MILLLSILFITNTFFSLSAFSQAVAAGTAPVTPPTTGFGIDGDLKANVPTPGVGDWLPNTATSGGVLSASGVAPVGSTTTFHRTDSYTSGDDIFIGGLKKNGDLTKYMWKNGSPTPSKCNINHLLVHIADDANGDTWITLAGDREATNGNSFISIALLQKELKKNADFTFTSGAPSSTGGRTAGDVQVSAEFTGGGANPNLYLEEWRQVSGVYQWVPISIPVGKVYAYGATNASSITGMPYTVFGGTSYTTNAFIEVSFNISEIYRNTATPCVGSIASMFVMTKSSQTENADLADFVDPLTINLDVNVGKPTVSGKTTYCVGETIQQLTASGDPGAAFTWYSGLDANGKPTGQLAAGSTFTPTISNSSAGTATYYVTASLKGCESQAAPVTVTVNALPTVSGTLSVCVGLTTQLTGSATAATSNPWVSSSTAVATVSNTGLVTGVSNGTANITYTNSNGCQKTVTVTVNALPDNPEVSVVQPTCSNSNGTVTVTKPVGSDYEYSNNGGAYQTNKTFTVAAGGSYSIRARRISTQCVSSGVATGTMSSASPTPAADVVIQSSPSCSSSTGTLKVVQKSNGADYDNTIFEFSSDGTNFTDNPVFTFTAGQGYSITVRRILDPTCTATATCTGELGKISSLGSTRQQTDNVEISLDPKAKITAVPNPFNDRIRFSLKSTISGQGSLELYNTLGQRIKTVYQGYISAGQAQTIEYFVPNTQRSNLVYVFRVGDQQTSGKLISIKQ